MPPQSITCNAIGEEDADKPPHRMPMPIHALRGYPPHWRLRLTINLPIFSILILRCSGNLRSREKRCELEELRTRNKTESVKPLSTTLNWDGSDNDANELKTTYFFTSKVSRHPIYHHR